MTTQVIQAAVDLIEKEEGCPLYAYDDAVCPTRPVQPGEVIRGTLTAGTGHIGEGVYVGGVYSQEQADAWLDADLTVAENAVDENVKVPLNDFQRGALVSFVFNVGVAAFEKSTLLKLLNAGNYDAVPGEMLRWNHTTIAGKLVVSDGLTSRRIKEAAFWKAMAAAVPPQVEVTHTQLPTSIGEPPAKPWFTGASLTTFVTAIAGLPLAGIAGLGALFNGTGPFQIALSICLVGGFLGVGFLYLRERLAPK